MPGGIIFIFILIAVFAIVMGYLSHLREKERREAFQTLAHELGMQYIPRDGSIPTRYGYLDALRVGTHRYAYNVLAGMWSGHPVQAFDYHYATRSTDSKGRRRTQHHHVSFFVLEQELDSPELRIYAEGFFSKLGQMLGFDDIDFESVEFSRAFCVRSEDKKFAYDICHARMMEYLLDHRDLSIEIEGPCVAIGFPTRLAVEDIPGRLDQLVEVRNLFPDYLYRQ